MTRHRLVVLLLDGVLPLDLAIPMQVFARESADFYDVVTASLDGLPVDVAGGGMRIEAGAALDVLPGAGTVVVPGYDGAAQRELDPRVLAALRAASDAGARMTSICSGAFALARAGLLDGLTVTTHWALGDDLARGFPSVTVDAAALFIDSGRVMTSGGVMAGADLALHILRRDRGDAIANHVARRIVMAPRAGSQGQFAEAPPVAPGGGPITATQQWMLDRLDEPLTVAAMAAHAHLSVRQLHRRFVEVAGETPLAWLLARRVDLAKRLLESTDASIDEIAAQSGLGTAAHLRVQFRRATGIAPSVYREAFWSTTSLGVA